jgi:hypothetical protein
MNRKLLLTFIVAGVLGFNSATAAEKSAEAVKKGSPEGGPNMEEMLKNWQAAAEPGEGHKKLEPLVGEWVVESRFWFAGPDGPPTETKGTSKCQWILEGRFVQEDFTGELMGKPFHGMGTTGYDNFKKKYVGTWMDNMGTAVMYSEGTADAEGKTFTFFSKMDDVMTGQKDKEMKHVLKILSPDKHLFEMHDVSLGTKGKIAEIRYTRKGS